MPSSGRQRWLAVATLLYLSALPAAAFAHGVADADKVYIEQVQGVAFVPFMYLGAKHMVTGYDHILFLVGVIFFLYRLKSVATYVTLFAVGHSITLIAGVLARVSVSAYLVDAVIGLSVVYKALDNLGAFRRWFGVQPSAKVATLVFGLVHGLGLATKMLDFTLPDDGLLPNLVAFNLGVELGQLCALSTILIAMSAWRKTDSFARRAYSANVALMTAGFVLAGLQLAGLYIFDLR